MTTTLIQSTLLPCLLLLCLFGQVLHGYLRIMHSNPNARRLVTLYECALLVHLLVMAVYSVGVAHYGPDLSVTLLDLPPISLFPILWLNIAAALACIYTVAAGMEDSGEPDGTTWMPKVEAVIILACIPPIINLLNDTQQVVLLAVDTCYFVVRTVYFLVCDRNNRRRIVSPLSLAEALKQLPEGMLYADERGRTIIANDAIKRCLAEVGISTDASSPVEVWNELNAKAQSDPSLNADEWHWDRGAWVVLRIREDEIRLFSFDGPDFEHSRPYPADKPFNAHSARSDSVSQVLGAAPYTRIIAYDVTEEITLIEEIVRTNDALAETQRELRATTETIREAAENEAMLRMKGRVHDVIGQRLSVLHRALEDNAVSNEELEQLKPLLTNILEDLSGSMQLEPADELSATVDAFALSGLVIIINGDLPADAQRAKLIADCTREAATNAVRHARASTMIVRIRENSFEISNDGVAAETPIVEKTGLSNMRRAVEAESGRFEVIPDPFVISVSFAEQAPANVE